MAFELNLTTPFHFSLRVTSSHLSMFWGRNERGFVLERGHGPLGKALETWRSQTCNSLNVAAFGVHLAMDAGAK